MERGYIEYARAINASISILKRCSALRKASILQREQSNSSLVEDKQKQKLLFFLKSLSAYFVVSVEKDFLHSRHNSLLQGIEVAVTWELWLPS